MSKEKLILVAAVGVAALMILPKLRAQFAGAGGPRLGAAAPVPSNNVNNEMWTKLLGGAWSDIMRYNGQSTSGYNGQQPFVMRDAYSGLYRTSDGKPLYTGDGATDFMIANTGLSGTSADWTSNLGNAADNGAANSFMAGLGL